MKEPRPGDSKWLFWDGDLWPFKGLSDLQLGIKRSRLESPGARCFLWHEVLFKTTSFYVQQGGAQLPPRATYPPPRSGPKIKGKQRVFISPDHKAGYF